ncbi:MAG: hypothetical protein N5P05_001113 [Chroococcopsis gigantea SAG 12.99]|jgi:putative integral membrane protein (TIGR02587 family)|nr:TIGR02587 family membrane protein [Chlorogloea purpurea SAG 13.99]MDV2999507.1 hypothetical protein [Chroococcopsis gigantea SAG 12.99]
MKADSVKEKNQKSLPPWRNEVNDVIRGASGGFLFGIPLIYTMEVWWIGSYVQPPVMLLVLFVTFAIVFLLNRTDGFRNTNAANFKEASMDSIEELAIGIVCTTLILILLREITLETSLNEALGKIIFEGVPFALGVALANSILQGNRDGNEDSPPRKSNTLPDIGATLIGSIFIGLNIAPTDEITMLSAAISTPRLLAVIFTSLIVSYGIVFVAGFTTQGHRQQHGGPFQKPLQETVLCYFLSLLSSAAMLWFFHRLTFDDPWSLWLSQTLVLGLPATIGGAAGRLAI